MLGVTSLEQSVQGSGFFGAIGQVNLDSYMGTTSPTPRQSMDRYDATSFSDIFRHAGQQAAAPISINTNSFGLATNSSIGASAQSLSAYSKSPTPAEGGARDTKNVEISENIVGAILGKLFTFDDLRQRIIFINHPFLECIQSGPSGSCLVKIQDESGATIQISKKGIFAPGTKNRIVTISGAPIAIARAHLMIEQKIQEEETKRRSLQQHAIMTGIMQ